MVDPTVPVAFFAGLVSFLSPCVLPLVPGYLSYMSGLGASEEAPGRRAARSALVATVFVLGFTAVFVALGATVTYLGSFLNEHQTALTRIGGVLIIAMGLFFIGAVRTPWLYREARFHPSPKAGVWGSAVLGAAFAFGWTPCIGFTMGAVLTMAAGRGATGGPAEGAFLLAVYSLGLGLPFILAGLGISHVTGTVRALRRHTRPITTVSGALLIGVGFLFATNQITVVSVWMQRSMTEVGLDFWSGI